MSWRTGGHYRNLSPKDQDWLTRFDREWDTKAKGRSRVDIYESHYRLTIQEESPAPSPEEWDPLEIEEIAEWVTRFTVPKRKRSRWGIYMWLTDGRYMRVSFQDHDTAQQAYAVLIDICAKNSKP